MKRLWVVEMLMDHNGKWEPTCGVAFTRDEGRAALRVWRYNNSDIPFRLRPYWPVI